MDTIPSSDRLRGLPLAIATLAVTLASFMNILDTTIAIVALPTISGNLGATPSQGSWVITSYGVCLAVVLPLSGWITRRFGQVRTFLVAVTLFTLTSWLCGIASSFNQLLLFRALQGFAGGLLVPISQSLLMRLYPPEKHGFALGIWGATSATAPVLGPLLGGYLTDQMGWPWIFYINIPFGILCVYGCWSLVRRFETETHREPVDGVGLGLLVVGVICFQLVMDRGHELDWFSSPQIVSMLLISLLCLVFFLAWERGEKHPVIDFSLFTHKSFVAGSVLISIVYTTFILGTVVYPIWLQTSLGYTATWSGIVMAPTSVLPLFLMPLIGQRLRQWDVRVVIFFGVLLSSYSYYLHAQSYTDSTATYFALVRLAVGIGMPLVYMPLMMVTLVGLPQEKLASAAGIFNFTRMLASSLGTAAGVTLWDQRTIFHRSRLVENISPESPQFQATMGMLNRGFHDSRAALVLMDQEISRQARTLAMDDLYYLCGVAILLIVVFVWLLPPGNREAKARGVT